MTKAQLLAAVALLWQLRANRRGEADTAQSVPEFWAFLILDGIGQTGVNSFLTNSAQFPRHVPGSHNNAAARARLSSRRVQQQHLSPSHKRDLDATNEREKSAEGVRPQMTAWTRRSCHSGHISAPFARRMIEVFHSSVSGSTASRTYHGKSSHHRKDTGAPVQTHPSTSTPWRTV